jgi:hypothetical protein
MKTLKILSFRNILKILKFYEWVRCYLIGRHNLTSLLWLVGGKARIYLTARELYSLWGRVEKMQFRPIRNKQNSLSFHKIHNDVTKFVSDLWQVFSRHSTFLSKKTWPPQYNWNIIESGVKHHNPSKLVKLIWETYGMISTLDKGSQSCMSCCCANSKMSVNRCKWEMWYQIRFNGS